MELEQKHTEMSCINNSYQHQVKEWQNGITVESSDTAGRKLLILKYNMYNDFIVIKEKLIVKIGPYGSEKNISESKKKLSIDNWVNCHTNLYVWMSQNELPERRI